MSDSPVTTEVQPHPIPVDIMMFPPPPTPTLGPIISEPDVGTGAKLEAMLGHPMVWVGVALVGLVLINQLR